MKRILLIGLSSALWFGVMAQPARVLTSNANKRLMSQPTLQMPEKNRLEKAKALQRGQKDLNSSAINFPVAEKNPEAVQIGSRASSTGSFYGYLVYSSVDPYLGIYQINPGNEYDFILEDPGYNALGFDLEPFNGWYVDGKINGISLYWYDAYSPGAYFSYSIDYATGELIDYKEYFNWPNFQYLFDVCTYNPDDELIYGYAFEVNEDYWTYYWAYANPDDPTNIQVIKEAEYGENFISICYKPEEELFYGITDWFDFVSIDTNGNIDKISSAPTYANGSFYDLQSGLIWDEKDGVFYWNAQFWIYDFNTIYGCLYSISPKGDFELVEQYSFDQEFSFFFTTETYINEDAPLKPSINSIDFKDASLTGSMSITLPSTFGDGSSLPSTVNYTALLNGEKYKTGTASRGQNVKIDYSVPSNGEYIFGVYVTADGIDSKTVKQVKYVGNDTPVSPKNVVLSPNGLFWQPVTSGVHNGFMDLNNLSYSVYLNDEFLGTTKSTNYRLDLTDDSALVKYTAYVIAICSGMESEPAYSNSIVAGNTISLPAFFEPTQEEFEDMTVVNVAGDTYLYEPGEITWTLTNYGLFSSGTEFNSYPMDDYIFLPPMVLQANHSYSIKFETGIYSNWYPDEYLNVLYAVSPDPDGVKGYILERYTPEIYLRDTNWETWDEVDLTFKVPEEDIYYLGFQCVSDPMQYGVYIRNIYIEDNDIYDGIESILSNDSPSISSGKNCIMIKGLKDIEIMVAGISGNVIYRQNAYQDFVNIEVQPGIYLVKAGDYKAKIIVR